MEQVEQTAPQVVAPATAELGHDVAVASTVAEVGHVSAAAQKAGMPQLDPSSYASQLFWLGTCLVVLYVILSRSVLPRVASVLDQRRFRREHDVNLAAQLQNEAETAKNDYEKLYADAKQGAATVIAETEAAMRAAEEANIAALDTKLAVKIQASDKAIKAALADALDKVAPCAAEVAATLVKAVAGKEPTSKQLDAVLSKVKSS